MTKSPFLGVCYYPEHWPKNAWAEDAQKMASLGIKQVRIGEFAWSRLEPGPGKFDWAWLDEAIKILGDHGLEVMLGTPTATPPKWLVDANPDILAYDEFGRPRKFGSRRHYCFSSETYAQESARIIEAIAQRYGDNPTVTAWQTDNEYGCHDTIRSYSPAAAAAFREWLENRYSSIDDLNEAWGCVFWSQEYRSFDEVDLPNLTVTEPNPSHALDFFRFSSDQVVRYNRMQTHIIRKHSPGRPITHNFMGFFHSFDHYAVAKDLDFAGWDSYPIGFLDVGPFPKYDKLRFLRQGHPDIAAFHHDLYRSVGRGRWRVLEQQPGPVNWAPHNPAPLPGMVRLWSLEAFAHGAESVNYFRWRQAPFAQEQMHAGLERPDHKPAIGFYESQQTADDLKKLDLPTQATQSKTAIIFSYDAHWLFEAQPQGADWHYPTILFEWYSALRHFGLDVDFISPDASFEGYDIIAAPSLPILDDALLARLHQSNALVLFGPRSGSKSGAVTIPDNLAPGPLQQYLPLKVTHVETFPMSHKIKGDFNGAPIGGRSWLDHVETALTPLMEGDEGGLCYRKDNFFYLTTLPDAVFLGALILILTQEKGIEASLLPSDLRVRRHGNITFLFNYGPETTKIPDGIAPDNNDFVLGGSTLPPAGVAAWRT